MLFPYREYQINPTPAFPEPVLYRPEVRVQVIGPAGDLFLRGLVDTGADYTVFPRSVANVIGLSLDDGEGWPVAGFTGHQLDVIFAPVDLRVMQREEHHRWRAMIGFVNYPSPEVEQTLLGRVGFLDQFRAVFDGKSKQLELQPFS